MPAVRGDGMRGLAVFISDIRWAAFPLLDQKFWFICFIRLRFLLLYPPVLLLIFFNPLFILFLARNCKSKEAEVKRINKELANIRSKFKVRGGRSGGVRGWRKWRGEGVRG